MKIKHTKNMKQRLFTGGSDLSAIARLTHLRYDPQTFNCKDVCQLIASYYNNLIPILVPTIIYRGRFKRSSHWVLKQSDGPFIIDPTGDQFDYNNVVKLKKQIAPWIYVQTGSDPNHYISINHMPYSITPDFPEPFPTDWDLIRISQSPFYQSMKCIILEGENDSNK